MTIRTVTAYQLRPGWIVLPPTGSPRRVALARCEGATPVVVVYWVGVAERTLYPATTPITIQDAQ